MDQGKAELFLKKGQYLSVGRGRHQFRILRAEDEFYGIVPLDQWQSNLFFPLGDPLPQDDVLLVA